MKNNFVLLFVAFATQCLPVLSYSIPTETNEENRILTNAAPQTEYRLPEDFDAIEYILTIKPFFEKPENSSKAFTFDGYVQVNLRPKKSGLTRIILHANGLTIETITVNPVGEAVGVSVTSHETQDTYDFLIINLSSPLDNKKFYEVNIKYTGILRTDMKGFYRSSYVENGITKWLVSTQMEPVSARKVLPCLDEPQYKATFTLTVIRPKSYSPTLSNMPIKTRTEVSDTEVSETFYTSPIMSTYLLAFIVSELKAAAKTPETEENQFGVWARPEASDMGKYAFETGTKLVEAMSNYTSIDYYKMMSNMKMDQVAVPDFSAGAMENWGLLTYKESYLMYDEHESSVFYRQEVNSILAHEIAHQWFGDLVTCNWWSNTWLNEGFATFFEYKLSDMVEDLDMNTQFAIKASQKVFLEDTSVISSPLTFENVNTPAEISRHFGTITYSKGGAIIRMMEHWIGEETLRNGLNYYLNLMKFKSAKPSDLFEALQKQAITDGSLIAYPGSNVGVVMSSWTTQSGYPVLYVNIDYDTGNMNITQERMVTFGEQSLTNVLYQIPITFATNNQSDFEDTKPSVIMKTKNIILNKGIKGHEWVVFNKKMTGFYRVNYDDHSWRILASELKEDSRTDIHTLNRAQVVDDILNFAKENVTDYATAFSVIQFLEMETDYAPWTAAINDFEVLRKNFAAFPDTLQKLDKHVLILMRNLITTLGLEEKITDLHLTKLFRGTVLNFACKIGHSGCIEDSIKRFEDLASNGMMVKANLREHVYCNGLRHGNESHFNFLWKKYLSEDVVNAKLVLLSAMGCTKDKKSLNTFLEQTIEESNPSIRNQDLMSAFNSALLGNDENVDVVFEFFRKNVAVIKKTYGEKLQSALSSMIGSMKGTQLQRVMAFLKSSSDLSTSEYDSGMAAIAHAGVKLEWAIMHKNTVESWLDSKYSGSSGITSSLASSRQQ